MGEPVAYSDIPDGFQVKSAPSSSYSDIPQGFSVKQQPSTPEPQLNAIERGAADRMLGVEELINNAGIGRHIGLPDNDIIEGAAAISKEQGAAARQGEGMISRAGSAIGEFAGDPLTYFGGGKAIEGGMKAAHLAETGARYGAASGLTDTGSKNLKENVKSAAEGGAIGGVAAPAIPAAFGAAKGAVNTGKLIGEGFHARTRPELVEAAANLRTEATEPYKKMRELNTQITPEAAATLKPQITKDLSENGLMNAQLHRGTLSVLKQLDNASKTGISLEALDQHRRLLSGVVNDSRGKEDGKMAAAAIRSIDNLVDNLKPEHLSNQSREAVDALKAGRAAWAKARKFETITDILEKAGNDPNRRKVLLEALANNKAKTRGWSKEELAALKEAAQNTTSEGLLKMAGKFGINIGSTRSAATGNAIPALEVMVQGAKKGLPVVAGGTIAKGAQNKIGQAKAERLLKVIEGGKGTDEAIGAVSDPLNAGAKP